MTRIGMWPLVAMVGLAVAMMAAPQVAHASPTAVHDLAMEIASVIVEMTASESASAAARPITLKNPCIFKRARLWRSLTPT